MPGFALKVIGFILVSSFDKEHDIFAESLKIDRYSSPRPDS